MSILLLGGCVSFPLVKHDKWPCSSCEDNCSKEDVYKYIEKPMIKEHDFMLNMRHNQKHMRKSVATWDYTWVYIYIELCMVFLNYLSIYCIYIVDILIIYQSWLTDCWLNAFNMTVISLLSRRSDESIQERVPKVITHANCLHCKHIHSPARPVPIQVKVYVYYKERCKNTENVLKLKQDTTMINLGCTCVVGWGHELEYKIHDS